MDDRETEIGFRVTVKAPPNPDWRAILNPLINMTGIVRKLQEHYSPSNINVAYDDVLDKHDQGRRVSFHDVTFSRQHRWRIRVEFIWIDGKLVAIRVNNFELITQRGGPQQHAHYAAEANLYLLQLNESPLA